MPETLIGFVPDVGGTKFLADAPGELGTLLALTGHTIDGEDAKACGLATHVVDAATLPALVPELVKALEPLARCGERSRSDVGERTHHPSDDEDDVDDDDDDARDPRREAARDAVRAVLSRLDRRRTRPAADSKSTSTKAKAKGTPPTTRRARARRTKT
jgi:enoyl-CoA hydratase/carnithine racemase